MATTKIRSSSITDGQVSNADLSATVAVTGGQIADDAITTAKILDNNVTTAKILDDNVTLAKMADGTQGDTLYYGAAGAPTLLAKPGTPADEVLTFATGASAPSWAAAASAANVPQFSVYVTAGWDLGNSSWTIVPFDAEDINDDGASGTCFNITASGTNPRGFTVPAGEAGKYAISFNINYYTIGATILIAQGGIYKGASGGAASLYTANGYTSVGSGGSNTLQMTHAISTVMDLAVGDHLYAYVNLGMTGASSNGRISGGRSRCQMNGFKLL